MKNHTKYKTKLLRALAAVSAGGFLLAQQAALLSVNVFAETIETPIYGENTKTLADITTMQEMTLGVCDRTPSYVDTSNYASKQLTDTRDGKTYWVAKLADGNCWMTQNLAIDLTGKTLTANDSDVSSNWSPVATGWSGNNAINWQISATGSEHGSYGGYYTWQAATANTAPASTGEASSSICPKGWRLPSNNSTNGPTYASLGLTTSDISEDPYYFVYGGYVRNGIFDPSGGQGYYWSSTAYNGLNAYILTFNSSGVYPSLDGNRFYGLSVRCANNPNVLDSQVVEINNPNVTVTVPPVLTMTLTESVDINVKSNAISTGNFVAKVTSNAPYTISLSATQNGHTDLQSAENGSIPASNDVKAGESGWGIKCIGTNCVNDSGTGILNTRYNALTAYGTPKIYFDSPTVAANQETSFEVGIGVNSSLASGTYATDVLVTAAQK